MSNDKPLLRYEPASHDVNTGIGSYTESYMEKDEDGSYVNRFELRERLDLLLADACDPGEKDALNNVIKLLGA